MTALHDQWSLDRAREAQQRMRNLPPTAEVSIIQVALLDAIHRFSGEGGAVTLSDMEDFRADARKLIGELSALVAAPTVDSRVTLEPSLGPIEKPSENKLLPKHSDDIAVDRFAAAMKAKLAEKRAQGYGGWDNKLEVKRGLLLDLLHGHLAKGDPVDVGNFAMMLHQRGEGTAT